MTKYFIISGSLLVLNPKVTSGYIRELWLPPFLRVLPHTVTRVLYKREAATVTSPFSRP